MRLLVIDYCTIWGHRNFNKIHIESLLRLGHSVHLIGREETFSYVKDLPGITGYTVFPKQLDARFANHYSVKIIKEILCLFWVKRKFEFSNYSAVIFFAYDIYSLTFFRTKAKTILVNHDNVAKLSDKRALRLTQRLPPNFYHVAITRDSYRYLQGLLNGKGVYYIPHGAVNAIPKGKKPTFISNDRKYVFCPVNDCYDIKLINIILDSELVSRFLKENGLTIIIKSILYNKPSENIYVIVSRISDEEYQYLLCNASLVILPYNKDYKYRSSGILFECVAAGTTVATSRIESMLNYQDEIPLLFFNDEISFIKCIKRALDIGRMQYDSNLFIPDSYWQQLL